MPGGESAFQRAVDRKARRVTTLRPRSRILSDFWKARCVIAPLVGRELLLPNWDILVGQPKRLQVVPKRRVDHIAFRSVCGPVIVVRNHARLAARISGQILLEKVAALSGGAVAG